MIMRKYRLYTLLDIVKAYFERLLLPENLPDVEAEFIDCFFQSKQRTKVFCQTLSRVVWEYNYINKMFIEHYKRLSLVTEDTAKKGHLLPEHQEILIFGGYYPLSKSQVTAILKIVDNFPMVKSLSFNFTRIKN